jgi:hypothetical protein
MDAADQSGNDQDIVMRADVSTAERAQMFVDNHGGHFENACCT